MKSDESIFCAQLEELIERQQNKNIVMASNFLNPVQALEALRLSRKGRSKAFLWGGYEDAERKKLFLLPDYAEREQVLSTSNKISALRIEAKTEKLQHKDYLGSVLALGLERRCLGDIVLQKAGAILFCDGAIASYIMDNLLKVGANEVSLRFADAEEYGFIQSDAQRLRINVASLRLDAVLAASFSLARGKVQEWIEAGYVNLNFAPCLQAGKSLSPGDSVSLRKYGRVKLLGLEGESRKGRLFLCIEKKARH